MYPRKVWAVYFSGTGTTKKTVCRIAETAAKELQLPWEAVSFTLPDERENKMHFSLDDLVIFGTPVYAGRVPNVLLPFLREKLEGGGALTVPVVLFGNRNYDDALIELRNLLQENHFACIAAAAFVGEHSFSYTLGAGRPDAEDEALMDGFAEAIVRKVQNLPAVPEETVAVRGEDPIRPYYKPRDRHGNFINILKVKPKTDPELCNRCGICATRCPMGAIDPHDPTLVPGTCIKCGACVKGCSNGAKYYDDEGYLYHKTELEEMYARRGQVEMFL